MVLVALLVLALAFFCFASEKMGFSLDAAAVQDVFLGQGSYQVCADLRAMVSDEFQIRVPLGVAFCNQSLFFETGMQVVYYPWHEGPFMSLSLFQVGFSSNCENLDNMVSLNEVLVGWTFEFGPGIFVEPSIAIRDPSGTFSSEYSDLKGTFPCYSSFRGRLAVGWYFWR